MYFPKKYTLLLIKKYEIISKVFMAESERVELSGVETRSFSRRVPYQLGEPSAKKLKLKYGRGARI